MTELNRFKFYFARYFFLALAALQGLAAILVLSQAGDTPKSRFAMFVFLTLAMILLSFQWVVYERLKQVVIDKKKIAVIYPHKTKQYSWDDVKELKHLPFFNAYSLKLKGKKKRIYFLPEIGEEALFGLFGKELQLINRK